MIILDIRPICFLSLRARCDPASTLFNSRLCASTCVRRERARMDIAKCDSALPGSQSQQTLDIYLASPNGFESPHVYLECFELN